METLINSLNAVVAAAEVAASVAVTKSNLPVVFSASAKAEWDMWKGMAAAVAAAVERAEAMVWVAGMAEDNAEWDENSLDEWEDEICRGEGGGWGGEGQMAREVKEGRADAIAAKEKAVAAVAAAEKVVGEFNSLWEAVKTEKAAAG